MKKGLGYALAAVLAVCVALAIAKPYIWPDPTPSPTGGSGSLTKVVGVVGSEKEPFFRDAEVKAAFAKAGYDVSVTTAGSLEIATLPDLKSKDFVFPSSSPAADKIKTTTQVKGLFSPFHSPIGVATFQKVADTLAQSKVATKAADGTWYLDMAAYWKLVKAGQRWNKLPGSKLDTDKTVLVSTTDVRRSNSAFMYLSLMSYVANGNQIVNGETQANTIADTVAPLFTGQGYASASSEQPFEDYLVSGAGKYPMLMIYEAQFLGAKMQKPAAITPDRLLMYPKPDVLSKHTLVAISDNGAKIGDLLTNDPTLATLAARYGFRPQQPGVFAQVLKEKNVTPPPDLDNVIEPPTYETLEHLVGRLATKYQ